MVYNGKRKESFMPEYSYVCYKCKKGFSVIASFSNYKAQETCPVCNLAGHVQRDLEIDWDSLVGSVIRGDDEITLGELAKRNSARLSNDEKAALTHKHRTEGKETVEQARQRTGLDFYGEQGSRKPSDTQRKSDPRR